MSQFLLNIQTDNAAFELRDFEVARILHEVADKVSQGLNCGLTRDLNGNRVGDFSFYE